MPRLLDEEIRSVAEPPDDDKDIRSIVDAREETQHAWGPGQL